MHAAVVDRLEAGRDEQAASTGKCGARLAAHG